MISKLIKISSEITENLKTARPGVLYTTEEENNLVLNLESYGERLKTERRRKELHGY